MNQLNKIAVRCAATAVIAFALTRSASADDWNKKTIVTFSQAVEIPGVVLNPGTYVFKLLDSTADRHIVQVLNERQNHVYATTFAIPKYAFYPKDKTHFTFYEMPAGQPEVVRTWFYPGDTIGEEFIYPAERQAQILAASRQGQSSETTVASNVTSSESTQSTAAATEQPAESSVTTEAAAVTPAPETDMTTHDDSAVESTPAPSAPDMDNATAPEQDSATPAPAPASDTSSMPATGSELPLIGLAGLASLAAAFGVRTVVKMIRL